MSVSNMKNDDVRLVIGINPLNQSIKTDANSVKVHDNSVKVHEEVGYGSSIMATIEVKASTDIQQENALTENKEQDEKKQTDAELLLESEVVSDAMKTISEFISLAVRTVNFTRDDGSEKTVIKIYDAESKELIKQFPSEEILAIARRIIELKQDISQKTGILLDESI